MEKSDNDYAVEFSPFNQFVGLGRDLSRIVITCVWDDQGPDIRGGSAFGSGQESPDLFFENFGSRGIECPLTTAARTLS